MGGNESAKKIRERVHRAYAFDGVKIFCVFGQQDADTFFKHCGDQLHIEVLLSFDVVGLTQPECPPRDGHS